MVQTPYNDAIVRNAVCTAAVNKLRDCVRANPPVAGHALPAFSRVHPNDRVKLGIALHTRNRDGLRH